MSEGASTGVVRDGDLVSRAAAGDLNAFQALVEPRLARAYRTASAILGDDGDADDVVQDVFLAVWRRLPRLRDHAKFDAWLNTAIVNRSRDILRQRRRRSEVILTDAHDRPDSDATARIDSMDALNAAFDGLTAEQRHILVLHHLHAVPIADLSRELGAPAGTVKWRLHAARAAFERALEAQR